MKTCKRIMVSATAFAMAALLSACGSDREAAASVHDYTYTTFAGNKYSGTYTGGWEGGQPNGEGSFSGKGEKGEVSLVGTWVGGQPNGQCRQIAKNDTYIKTYSGDFFYGEVKGEGDFKIEDLDGNLVSTYSGGFREGKYDGSGEITYYYTDAESGYGRKVYKGQFADGAWNGKGELAFYNTPEYAAQCGCDRRVFKGQFSDNVLGGEAEMALYFTQEHADAYGFDCEIWTGQYKDDRFAEPCRYALYKDGKVLEEGRIRDGDHVSDTEKAFKDGVYDLLRGVAGDGIVGDLYDIFAPEFYDRNGE